MYRLIVSYIAYFLQAINVTLQMEVGNMDTITAVKNRIFKLCYDRNISINRLATICALPPSSVKNILYGKSQNPKLLTIKMICDGLDITLAEFFDTDEFNNLEQEIK